MQQTKNRYSPEFKEQAVELARTGKPVAEVAEELGVGSGLIYRWLSERTQSVETGKNNSQAEEASKKEFRRLQKENARLQLENDILKKAAVILGNKHQPNGIR